MDTGGKIATGVLVPIAIVGAAVGGYFLLSGSKKTHKSSGSYSNFYLDSLRDLDSEEILGGKRRRTQRRRR